MTKTLGTEFNNILTSAVHIINYIRGRPLKSRLFAELCESMGAGFTTLLYHTEVRLLSRGKVLSRLYELKEEILVFLMSEGQEKDADLLVDDDWSGGLAYLCDIFQHLNILNSSLQGPDDNLLKSTHELSAFRDKLSAWSTRLENGNYDMFPLFKREEHVNLAVIQRISDHLHTLQTALDSYFPHLNAPEYDWIRDPFVCPASFTDDYAAQNGIIEMK